MNAVRLSHRFAKPLRQSCIRSYTTLSELPPLPPLEEWRHHFTVGTNYSRENVSLWNPHTAARIAHSFLSNPSPASGNGKIIIEAYPGPGALSRALLTLPKSKVRKLIILEDHEQYLKFLRPLEEADSRVKVIPLSGFNWDTYSHIEDLGLLDDVETHAWETLHPQLHFISHLEHSIKGEQLIAQLYRCIPEKTWLFKYGRVPMSLIVNNWVWSRISSGRGKASRCKLTVIAEATSESMPSLASETLQPTGEHFFPPLSTESRRSVPLHAINIIPLEDQIITRGMLDKWDYCLRRLFVLKSTPLKRAIGSLAPGAQTLLKILTDPNLPPEQHFNINKSPRDLSVAEWALLLRAFDDWPFAPE
ncbi:S-adenosyl-L-methionine-dependent methyltransferase, partial [Sparassis latifolia]